MAPLDRPNVDTDAIIPKQFLKSIRKLDFKITYLMSGDSKQGFPGKNPNDRQINPDFVLNQSRYEGASIYCAEKILVVVHQENMHHGLSEILGSKF